MRSRILIAVGAWLLGALAATAGSLYAVDRLGQGLFAQGNKQVTVARVNAEIAMENAQRHSAASSPSPPARPAPLTSPSASATPSARTTQRTGPDPSTGPPGPSPTSSAGQLLTSADGTVVAICQPGGAYLLQESPQQGYEVDDVVRGPAAVASVTFSAPNGGVIMKVSCAGSQPVAHVTPLWARDE